MITELSKKSEELVERAKQFAALSGVFDPKLALPDGNEEGQETIVEVASALAAACDTNPDKGGGWLLRTSERRYILSQLRRDGRLEQAIEHRRKAAGLDQETDDMLAAIAGASPFGLPDIQREVDAPSSVEWLHRIVVALDRAGEEAPAWKLLQAARAALARKEREARRELLHERGFFGRSKEQAALADFLANANTSPPAKAAFISGLPGIGKSALIEEVTYQLTDRFKSLNVRLDFDRAGLDILDIRGLTMEAARQLADRLGPDGEAILKKRLEAASYMPGEDASSLSSQSTFPHELAEEMGRAVKASGRPVLFILDTLEVLRARGNEHPPRLFAWIDSLIVAGVGPMRIIAAGRGDALDSCAERVGESFALDGLDPVATDQLLEKLGVAPKDRSAVARIADGNPLVLRLAADIAARFGTANLPAHAIEKEAVAGFLYRFLLSRIEDPLLKKLAHPGLVLRRISADLLREVLAPELGVPALREDVAKRLFSTLANEHWLVTPDPSDSKFVIHRSDMRLALLPLLYSSEPNACARIDAAAVRWFGRRKDAASQLDAAYHRFQLMRKQSRSRPLISREIAHGFDQQMLAELPEVARDIVLRTTGGRSTKFRQGSGYSGQSDDSALALELTNLVEKQDWAEGQYLVRQAIDEGGFDVRSVAADAVRAFYWRAGRWSDARRLLAERDRLGPGDDDLDGLRKPIALARLEMRAEFGRLGREAKAAAERITADSVGGALSLSRHGALGMILAADRDPAAEQMSAERSRGPDPVAAAFEHWAGRPGYAERQALDLARERLSVRGTSLADEAEGNLAQLFAVHTPYAGVAVNLSTQDNYHWIADDAQVAEKRLSSVEGLFGSELATLPSSTRSNPIAGLAGLGLFAEWIDLLGFLKRDPSLRAIGRAAERWRQTIAGSWRFGRAPKGWKEPGRLDAALASRLDALRHQPDPVDAARSQLQAILPPEQGLDLVTRRLSATLDRASKVEGAEEAAVILRRYRVPSALIPPLAILVHEHLHDLGR
jgi:hypothetical protein